MDLLPTKYKPERRAYELYLLTNNIARSSRFACQMILNELPPKNIKPKNKNEIKNKYTILIIIINKREN